MNIHTYLPQDRLRALSRGETLPDRTSGSALFADISGFTALTEGLRNSLGPRRGGEELTKHLDAVYTALITPIEKYGGSVIGFAGDAIICWFDEALINPKDLATVHSGGKNPIDPSSFAVSCAFAMQAAMRAFASINLPNDKTVALSLKVTVASGPARRFVVGDPTIHLIDALAGATVTRTSTAEHLAQKGEVILDEATVSVLGEALTIKEWREDHDSHERFAVVTHFSGATIRPTLPSTVRPPAANKLRPWLHQPVYEREQAGEEFFLAEFRPCVALFVRFVGIDFEADRAPAQLEAFVRQAQTIAAHYGGTLMDITIGDKGSYAYINFGALAAHEDDARRALKAALDLTKDSAALGFLAPLHIGLTQGLMRIGAYGGQTRRTYGALADEVNLAARLMQTAAPGQILLSGAIQKATANAFAFEPRAPLTIKGKAEPLPVFAVTGERQSRAIRLQEPTHALPMVGRERELAIINEQLAKALQGQGQVIGIVAEAGMGKSRLVAEAIRSARKMGFAGFGGVCQSDSIHTPYQAWKSIWSAFFDVDPDMPLRKQIRWLENEIEDRAPERVEALPLLSVLLNMEIPDNAFTQTLEPKYRLSALKALLEDCLRAAAQEEPLLIVIEDLHWSDALSHDLLEDFARTLSDSRVCFVLAYRPPELQRLQAPRLEALPHFTKIELRELSLIEAEQAIRAKLAQLYPARGDAVPIGLVEKLMVRSQGNPFYLEELLNFLRDRGLDPRDPAALEKIELPNSLHSLILSRIDQLSEREKTTLRVASIVGRFFRAEWLTGYYPELGGLARVQADLAQLAELDITPIGSPAPELEYLFKHIVTHEVTYESLPFATRAKLHEQLAAYLEQQIVAGTLAETFLLDTLVYHYERTDNHAKQREYFRKAGEAALEVSAFMTATEYFARLVELTPAGDPTRSALALKLAEAHNFLSNFSAARLAIEQAQAAATTAADRAAALVLLGEMTNALGNYGEAQTILIEAVSLARASGDRLTLCRALSTVGANNWALSKLDDARVALEESLALARALGNLTRELFALNRLGVMYLRIDLAEAERIFKEVHTRAVAAGNRERAMSALNNLGAVAHEHQDDTARRLYQQQALALAREIGAQQMAALFLINLANGDIKLGQLAAARMELQEGLVLAFRLGVLQWVVFAVTSFAELAYAEGQINRALALYGLARSQPAWNGENQRTLAKTLSEWALDPSVVEAELAKGSELDWNTTVQGLLKGG